MNSNKAGNPCKIINFWFVQLAWCEVRNLLNFVGTITWCQVRNSRFLLVQLG